MESLGVLRARLRTEQDIQATLRSSGLDVCPFLIRFLTTLLHVVRGGDTQTDLSNPQPCRNVARRTTISKLLLCTKQGHAKKNDTHPVPQGHSAFGCIPIVAIQKEPMGSSGHPCMSLV